MSIHLSIAVVCLLSTPGALGQQEVTGSISGFVSDPAGLPVEGAKVVATDPLRGLKRTAFSDRSGLYRLTELPPAEYDIRASAVQLQASESSRIVVGVDARVRVNFRLRLKQVRQSVQVSPSEKLVQSQTSDEGTVMSAWFIQRVPLNQRDFLRLALLVPGILPAVQDSKLSARGSFAMHASGGREEYNDYLLDGADNNDPYINRYDIEVSADAIQEFKIEANSYSAEYGRNAGGQVNVITRRGTNKWHGTAYEYARNRALDARNFFDGSEKPEFVRNQFGASMGGPVIRDRSFLFANIDGLKERQGSSNLATVPTVAERSGNFAGSGVSVVDPFTGSAFPGDVIPASRISPLAPRLLALFPLPNLPGTTSNYLAHPLMTEDQWEFIARADERLSSSGELTVRYAYSRQNLREPYTQGSVDVPGFGDIVNNTGNNLDVHYQQAISARTINALQFVFEPAFRQVLPWNYQTDVGTLWGVNWLGVQPRDFGYPLLKVSGFPVVGDGSPLPTARNMDTYHWLDNVSMSRGNHGLSVGGGLSLFRLNGYLDLLERGSLSFSGAHTQSGLGDLLLGLPSFAIQSHFDNPQTLHDWGASFYVQDDWSATRNLTLNGGLRYEYNAPPTDPTNRMSVLDLATGEVVRVGTNGIPRAGYREDGREFAPRVGLAWAPMPRLAIRAGYGIYYDVGMLEVSSALYFNPPYFNLEEFFPTRTAPLTLDNPFPSSNGFSGPPSLNTLSPDLTTAYLQQWSLDIQRQLGSSTLLSVAYAGSKGTHLLRSRDLNQPPPGPGPLALRRPDSAYGGILFVESGSDSKYESFQASLNRQVGEGLSLLAAYTVSKSIDDTSAFLSTTSDKNFPQNSHDFRSERGLSSFDMPQRLAIASVYTPSSRHWWARNFEVAGIVTAQSGQPFTPMLQFDNSNTGNVGGTFGSDRPNVVGDPHLAHPGPAEWFNTAAFAVPAQYTFGNAGRNILRGPGLFSIDLSLSRNFRLREGWSLSLVAQSFNVLNHTQFNLPEAFADNPATFGKIFSAKAPRQIQLACRLSF